MGSVLVVSRDGSIPSPLPLLDHGHGVTSSIDETLRQLPHHDVVVIDARTDLAWTRTALSVIRSTGPVPVLLWTTGSALALLGGDWGFTDFVLDGCEPAEFGARVRLLMHGREAERVLSVGPIRVDEDAYQVTVAGKPVDLTYTEFELLRHLVQHQGKVLTREVLLSQVWGYDYFGGTRTVDVHIRRLRAKLGQYDQFIGTVRNVGYRLATPWEDTHD
ncbi:DNA-binding response regulator [Arachnia propionica]|uniref:DNA-binding response regulator n=1 Tax=Arachnia propionica TaxID=1750 RepID=A0A3P1T4A6_9ACTN|nr:response regulator transcription factor [Arachnia propionica]MDO5083193.1 response regulator transcription factor [Arachnia propionica]RRD04128.1 DNA-binding response regulator [Arachnia propionica]